MKDFIHNVIQFLTPAFLAFCTFVSPIAGVLSAVGIFIAADAIFARYRVYMIAGQNKARIKAGEELTDDQICLGKWTSRKFRAGLLPKVITYNCFVLSFFVMDKFVINEFIALFTDIPFALTKILAMVLIYIELKSIDESFEAVKGKSLFMYLIEMLVHFKKLNAKVQNVNPAKKDKAPKIEANE